MHPTFIFLLSLLGVCTATFFGGNDLKSLPVLSSPPQPSHPHVIEHEHVHTQASPKIIKVILKTDHSHDHSHESGHSQIIKVIHENSGRSNDHEHHDFHEQESHRSHSSDSSFLSILPQILQIVLADEGRNHGHAHHDSHGHGGSFFSTVSKGANFYKGGHVIEKGELKLTKIPNNKNYDDISSDGGLDKGSLLSALFAKKPNAGPPGWSSASSGWSSGWN